MKRLTIGILAVLLVLSTGIPTAYAASHECRRDRAQTCVRDTACGISGSCAGVCEFVDSDKDGICERCENRCAGCGETRDENDDGICDNCGICLHSADENGNGVCGLSEACKNKTRNASCGHTGAMSGHHCAGH